MNAFNNDTMPFQNKVVGIEIPDDIETIENAVLIIAQTLVHLYGLIVGIFKNDLYYIQLNPRFNPEVLKVIRTFDTQEKIIKHLDIIPFPKKI
jgi:hypothetical protein